MHTVNMMPPQYIGFAEDMMLILFLVCILATLVTVHRATCYRYGCFLSGCWLRTSVFVNVKCRKTSQKQDKAVDKQY